MMKMMKKNYWLLGMVSLPLVLLAQQNDPFGDEGESLEGLIKPRKIEVRMPKSAQVRLEWLEVDSLEALELLEKWKPLRDASQMRLKLLSLDSTKMEDALLISKDFKGSSSIELVAERVYPTEFEPPAFGKLEVKVKSPKTSDPLLDKLLETVSSATPTAFETRNTGSTVKVDLMYLDKENSYDVEVDEERVSFVKMISYGHKELMIEMPLFATQRGKHHVVVKPSQWRLMGMERAIDVKTGKLDSSRSRILLMRVDALE